MTDKCNDVLALDLGGSKLALAMVRRDGTLSLHARQPTASISGGDDLVAWVKARVEQWQVEPAALGVSAGGPLDDERGVITRWPRMEMLWDYPLSDGLQGALPSVEKVQLVNDASAACAGVAVFGAGRGLKRVIYLTISTGVGGGAVVGGRLLRGDRGNAAEFGHMVVRHDGPRCDCGAVGCLEAVAAGSGLYRRLVRAGLLADEEFGWAGVGYWIKERLEEGGHEQVEQIWDEALDGLAVGMVSLFNCFVPQAMVIGGGLSRLVRQYQGRLEELLAARACLMPIPEGTIRFSEVPDTIPLLGVAAVAGGWIDVEA